MCTVVAFCPSCFFFQAEDGIRDLYVTGVQTCALPISEIVRHCLGGGRESYETCWPESIVSVLIPLIAKHSGGQRGDLARPECCNAGVPPEPHSAVSLRHVDRVAWRVWRCAHPGFRAAQCVVPAAT